MPLATAGGALLNVAVVFQKGKIQGIVPKTYLPNYKEFYERRWFVPADGVPGGSVRLCGQLAPLGRNLLFEMPDVRFGVELCEDLWAPVPPSSMLAMQGAEVVFNLSADTESIGKHGYLRSLLSPAVGALPGRVRVQFVWLRRIYHRRGVRRQRAYLREREVAGGKRTLRAGGAVGGE